MIVRRCEIANVSVLGDDEEGEMKRRNGMKMSILSRLAKMLRKSRSI